MSHYIHHHPPALPPPTQSHSPHPVYFEVAAVPWSCCKLPQCQLLVVHAAHSQRVFSGLPSPPFSPLLPPEALQCLWLAGTLRSEEGRRLCFLSTRHKRPLPIGGARGRLGPRRQSRGQSWLAGKQATQLWRNIQ